MIVPRFLQVFESSALFESGLQFHLCNFEHVVTHLERAREKINFHLNSEDQVIKVWDQNKSVAEVTLLFPFNSEETKITRIFVHLFT